MINSPSLSFVPTAPKAEKLPTSSQDGSSNDFGSVFDATNRVSNDRKTPASQPKDVEKAKPDQPSDENVVAEEPFQAKDTSSPQEARQDQPVNESRAASQSQDAQTDDEKSQSAQTKDEVDHEAPKRSELDENGKERQADGQSLAGDSLSLIDGQNTATNKDSEAVLVRAESSPAGASEADAEQEGAKVTLASDVDVAAEGDEASPQLDVNTDQTTKTNVVGDGLTEPSESQIDASEPIIADNLSGSIETQVSSSEDIAEGDEQATPLVSGNSQSDTSRESSKLGGNVEESLATAEQVRQSVSQTTLDSEHVQLENEQSEVAAETVVPSNVRLNAESIPDNAADDLTAEESVELESVPVANNLRWAMEQLSKRTQQAESSPNTAPNVMAGVTSSTSGETLASVLQEGNVAALVDNDSFELPKDLSEVLGSKKTLDQMFSGFNNPLQASTQGLNSAVVGALNATVANARPEGAAAQLTMHSLPENQAWPSEMASKVSWVAKEGFKTAHIQLDPPELGSLTVKVSMDQDSNTHVSFIASSAHARDALEGQIQRLRDMLQQQGVELDSVDVEVSQGNGQAFGSESSNEEQGQTSGSGIGANGDLDEADGLENISYVLPAEQGIDYYA